MSPGTNSASTCGFRAAPGNEPVTTPLLQPGTVLRATDRDYVVLDTGQWCRRPKAGEMIPAKNSNIIFPRKPSTSKNYAPKTQP